MTGGFDGLELRCSGEHVGDKVVWTQFERH